MAFVATLLVFAATLVAFGWLVAECVDEVVERWPRHQPRFDELARTWGARAEEWGLPHGGGEGTPASGVQVSGAARGLVSFAEGALLTLALTVLGLLEVQPFREKLTRAAGSAAADRIAASAHQASARFGRYFATRTILGVIQGVCTAFFAWAVGLDLALVWGVLSAVLNYVPTIGSALAVIPPALFAIVQFAEPGKALLVVGGLAAVQLVLGNYVDPRLQGRRLSLSPFVVLLAVAFWGWLWGPAGALIAVPIVIALVIAGEEFSALRSLSVLLAGGKRDDGPGR
jgi:predicted PurR-regulated permease PerM